MIEFKQGNLLSEKTEVIVNAVNCVGVMGKGIALQFKQAYPENFRQYEKACRAGEVQPGKMFTVLTSSLFNPKYIINFPTKSHWKNKSQIEDIQRGLVALIAEVQRLGITSIAIPPLGCGNGGLDWLEVKPLIESAFAQMSNLQVIIFEPLNVPAAEQMQVATKKNIKKTITLEKWLSNFEEIPGLAHLETLHFVNYYIDTNQSPDINLLKSLPNLKELYFRDNAIRDISSLASLTNLTEIYMGHNQISDISPLASLSNLKKLDLNSNQITHLEPLAFLNNLTELSLFSNQIIDLKPLKSLINLKTLSLWANQIVDIKPLESLTNLKNLKLVHNPISKVQIEKLKQQLKLTNRYVHVHTY